MKRLTMSLAAFCVLCLLSLAVRADDDKMLKGHFEFRAAMKFVRTSRAKQRPSAIAEGLSLNADWRNYCCLVSCDEAHQCGHWRLRSLKETERQPEQSKQVSGKIESSIGNAKPSFSNCV